MVYAMIRELEIDDLQAVYLKITFAAGNAFIINCGKVAP